MQINKRFFNFRARLQPTIALFTKCSESTRIDVEHDNKKQRSSFCIALCILLFSLFCSYSSKAQTTINTALAASTSTAGPTITFAVENTNPYGIVITDILNFHITSNNAATYTLWYSATQLTGAPTIATPAWTAAATGAPITLSANAITNVITGMNLLVPAGTTYRLAIVHSNTAGSVMYANPGTPTSYSAGGVNMLVGTHPTTPGYTGAFPTPGINGRWIAGGITFISACMAPSAINFTGITSNSANISWASVPSSAGYEYNFSNSVIPPSSGTPTPGTTYNAIGLSSSTKYYMHVRNKCTGGSFSNWAVDSFTTANNPCPYPAGISVNPYLPTKADISWSVMAGSLGYEYVVDQIVTPPLAAGTATNATTINITGLTGGTTYYVHLRNKCSSTGGTWSDWTVQQFTTPECTAPVNILFSNITGTSADMIWSVMAVANYYEYQIDENYDPPASGSGLIVTTGMTASLTGLSPARKYYAHIRSQCFIDDYSLWALDSFVTDISCKKPDVKVNNAGTSTPDASWDPVIDAIAYEYAVKKSATPPAFGIETTTRSLPVTLPSDNEDYYLHVRAKCNSMYFFSEWSTVALRVNTTGINNIDGNFDVSVYPNPVKDILHIATGSSKHQDVDCVITDLTGKEIKQFSLKGNNAEMDMSALLPGIYILKCRTEKSSQTIKFTKL